MNEEQNKFVTTSQAMKHTNLLHVGNIVRSIVESGKLAEEEQSQCSFIIQSNRLGGRTVCHRSTCSMSSIHESLIQNGLPQIMLGTAEEAFDAGVHLVDISICRAFHASHDKHVHPAWRDSSLSFELWYTYEGRLYAVKIGELIDDYDLNEKHLVMALHGPAITQILGKTSAASIDIADVAAAMADENET